MEALSEDISLAEVSLALSQLPTGKAGDAAGVTAECLRVRRLVLAVNADGAPYFEKQYIFAPALHAVFSALFTGGGPLPPQFAENTLTPIYKGKGERSDMGAYRGIAVGSLYARVYESIMHRRLQACCDEHGLRIEAQCGFRRGRGTLDALFTLQHLSDKVHATRQPLYGVLVDFTMAFDLVDRQLLGRVWESMGVSGPFLEALRALYEDVHVLVKQQGRLGDPIPTLRGTKQGSVLSPLVFGLFIERLRLLLAARCPGAGPTIGSLRVPELLYADDLIFLANTVEEMQQLLDVLAVFCHAFRMVVNLRKTWGIVFRPSHISLAAMQRRRVWHYQGTRIIVKDSQAYLGLLFTGSAGAGAAAAAQQASAARGAMHVLLLRMRQMQVDQPALLCKLFDTLVAPILDYGCQVGARCL